MEQEQVCVMMNDFEQRVVIKSLNDFRNTLIENDFPTDDVDDVLLKVIDAGPKKRRRHRNER